MSEVRRTAMKRLLVLVLCLLGGGAQRSRGPGALRSKDPGAQRPDAQRSCPTNQQCISEANCPAFTNLKAKWSALPKGNAERARLLEQLKASVCEMKDRLVCCAVNQEVSGGSRWTEPHQFPFMVLIVITVGGMVGLTLSLRDETGP